MMLLDLGSCRCEKQAIVFCTFSLEGICLMRLSSVRSLEASNALINCCAEHLCANLASTAREGKETNIWRDFGAHMAPNLRHKGQIVPFPVWRAFKHIFCSVNRAHDNGCGGHRCLWVSQAALMLSNARPA